MKTLEVTTFGFGELYLHNYSKEGDLNKYEEIFDIREPLIRSTSIEFSYIGGSKVFVELLDFVIELLVIKKTEKSVHFYRESWLELDTYLKMNNTDLYIINADNIENPMITTMIHNFNIVQFAKDLVRDYKFYFNNIINFETCKEKAGIHKDEISKLLEKLEKLVSE